jgi:hypothetical protein
LAARILAFLIMNEVDKYYIEEFDKELIEDIPYFSNKFITQINEILVEEMYGRYVKLLSKKIQYPEQFNEKDIKQFDEIRRFIKEENDRKIDLKDRMNRFLNEHLPK